MLLKLSSVQPSWQLNPDRWHHRLNPPTKLGRINLWLSFSHALPVCTVLGCNFLDKIPHKHSGAVVILIEGPDGVVDQHSGIERSLDEGHASNHQLDVVGADGPVDVFGLHVASHSE